MRAMDALEIGFKTNANQKATLALPSLARPCKQLAGTNRTASKAHALLVWKVLPIRRTGKYKGLSYKYMNKAASYMTHFTQQCMSKQRQGKR